MRIWLPFTTLAFYVYDIVFSRFSYDCKRPYKTMWSVFRTKPNNVVHTQIVFRASFSFLTEISPLLSVWFTFCLLPYFQPFFVFFENQILSFWTILPKCSFHKWWVFQKKLHYCGKHSKITFVAVVEIQINWSKISCYFTIFENRWQLNNSSSMNLQPSKCQTFLEVHLKQQLTHTMFIYSVKSSKILDLNTSSTCNIIWFHIEI